MNQSDINFTRAKNQGENRAEMLKRKYNLEVIAMHDPVLRKHEIFRKLNK